MTSSFDAVDFALYLRSRWRVVAICCASAVLIAGLVGKTLPKRYTATATIIIQPPAGADPRTSQAVSPVYLESLKTYENYATSDSLFFRALRELDLLRDYPNSNIESLKRSLLNVSKPAATRIIEITATLRDPVSAKRLAQFIAEQTVAMTRPENGASVEALSADLRRTSDLKYDVQRNLGQARTDLADLMSQRGLFPTGDEKAEWNAREIAATTARVKDLDSQQQLLEAAFAEKAALLEHATSAFRGERLEVLDPGIVPERPSYPNVPLIILVAFAVSLLAAFTYLAAAFGYGRAVSVHAERVYHMR